MHWSTKLKKHLIEFPEKPFWKFWVDPEATPELIEERRESLEEFFKHILHNKHTKNHKLIVNFMKIAHQRRDMGPEVDFKPYLESALKPNFEYSL